MVTIDMRLEDVEGNVLAGWGDRTVCDTDTIQRALDEFERRARDEGGVNTDEFRAVAEVAED